MPNNARRVFTLTIFTVILMALAALAPAQPGRLNFEDVRFTDLAALGITEPQGIAYHPIRQTLFIVAKNPGRVAEITLSGELVGGFEIPEVRKPEGIAYDPLSGDLVICRGNNVLWRAAADGSEVSPFLVLQEATDADGVAVHPVTGTFFVTDDDAQTVFEFDRTGVVLRRIVSSELLADFTEPQGIGFFGTDMVISDDFSKALYLVSVEGELLQTLASTRPLGFRDPEGVTVIGQERICSISDDDALMLCFVAVPQRRLTIPASLGLERSFIGVAAVNTSAAGNPLNAYGYTAEGWQTVFDQVPITGSGQAARLAQEFACCGLVPAVVGAGKDAGSPVQAFTLTGQRADFQGFFMAGDFSLNRLDGIGGSLEESAELVLPIARQAGEARTILFVFNPDSLRTATVAARLHLPDGSVSQLRTLQLPPFGSLNQDLAEVFGNEVEIEGGYVQLSSDRPLQAAAFLVDPQHLSAAAGQRGDETGVLIAPHFFSGAQLGGSTLTLINLKQETNTVEITAHDDQGTAFAQAQLQIRAGEQYSGDLGELLGLDPAEVVQGYLVLTHRGPVVSGFTSRGRLAGLVTFEDAAGRTRSSLGLLASASESSIFPHVAQNQSRGVFQGLAVLNRSEQGASVVVRAYDQAGALRAEATLALAPHERMVALLDDARLFGAGFEQEAGYLRVEGDAPLISISLFGGAGFLSAIERSIPVAPAP